MEQGNVQQRTFWWCCRKFLRELELDPEIASSIRSTLYVIKLNGRPSNFESRCFGEHTWAFDYTCNIQHILFVCLNTNAFRRVLLEVTKLSHQTADSCGGYLWQCINNYEGNLIWISTMILIWYWYELRARIIAQKTTCLTWSLSLIFRQCAFNVPFLLALAPLQLSVAYHWIIYGQPCKIINIYKANAKLLLWQSILQVARTVTNSKTIYRLRFYYRFEMISAPKLAK